MTTSEYLLAGRPVEADRLRIQALAWEPEVETMLNEIGVERGWTCIDAGCGPMGIIGPLARRVGGAGKVYALDSDPVLLEAARQYAESDGFANVVFRQADLFINDIPSRSFDLVHARFLLTPLGRDQEVLDQLTHLVKDGGIIALEEPDATTWRCDPVCTGWDRLKDAIVKTYATRGGDFNVGARLGTLLGRSGIRPVSVRESVLTIPGRHPYSALILQLAQSLRPNILEAGLMGLVEFQTAVQACQELLESPYCFTQTFRLVQAWGGFACPYAPLPDSHGSDPSHER